MFLRLPPFPISTRKMRPYTYVIWLARVWALRLGTWGTVRHFIFS